MLINQTIFLNTLSRPYDLLMDYETVVYTGNTVVDRSRIIFA